jgi:DNA-binding transcriptional LysR family regulator
MTTMAAKLATLFSKTLGLTVSPAPLAIPDMAMSMIWHASYDDDPAHKWLRNLILRECRTL